MGGDILPYRAPEGEEAAPELIDEIMHHRSTEWPLLRMSVK
ncbi:MAG TPA: hypothetical protein VG368_03535 [Acidimicrobiales bacterium]|nr:hypothetical protein [Acidimicrobiales bacterium]